MQRTGYNSVHITKARLLELEGISSLSVSNYGAIPIYVAIGTVKRTIPAFNVAINAPYIFTIDGDGTLSDINISIGSDVVGSIDAIVDYRKQKC